MGCADELGDDIQYVECTNLFATKESYFKLRFTDLLGNRYNTRAIVIRDHAPTDANRDVEGPKYTKAASHSIQTALESLPNFAIPKVEVTATTETPPYSCTSFNQCTGSKKNRVCTPVTTCDYTKKYTLKFEVKFTNAATFNPTCTISREPSVGLREKAECSNRGLCNRKTAECNCFDGYTGLACDTVAQTY